MSINHCSLNENNGEVTLTATDYAEGVLAGDNEEFKVFKKKKEGFDFRTVGRTRAATIYLKGII